MRASKHFALACGILLLAVTTNLQSVRAIDDSRDFQEQGNGPSASQRETGRRVSAGGGQGQRGGQTQIGGQTQTSGGESEAEAGEGAQVPAQGQAPGGGNITFLHDVVYGQAGDKQLHIEIAMPKGKSDKPVPAVLYFHPGGFVEGSHKPNPISFLANKGYFTGSVEYRFSNEAIFPAQLQDAQLAVRWLRAHAKEYNVDPKRIAAWGGSAGAIISQWLGTMRHSDGFKKAGGYDDQDDSVQAVVSFFGSCDATLRFRIGKISTSHKNSAALMGCEYKEDPERYKRNSAVTYVRSDDPPFFILQGALDQVAIPEQGEEMDKALTEAKVPHELIIVKNAGHMFGHPPNAPPPEPTKMECRKRAVEFLNKYLKGAE